MRTKYLLGSLLAVSALTAPITAQAQQFLTIAQVLRSCPDLDQARDCPDAAAGFLGAGARSDVEISTLALNLAQSGRFPRVPLPVCLNTADGIRVLARGANSGATTRQLNNIADSLCLGGGTAAIPGATAPGPAASLVSETTGETTTSTNGGSTNGGDTNGGGSTNGGDTNGGDENGGDDNGGHGNGGDDNGGHGNGGHGNGGHGNGGHGNGGHGNGGHDNGGHGNGGDDNGGHGNGGHGKGKGGKD